MRSRLFVAAALGVIAIAASVLSACGSDSSNGTLNGAGATFPQPVYEQWASTVKDNDKITVNYNPVGSGGGVAQFTAGTVDFGASDPPLKPEELAAAAKKGSKPLQIPTVFGAVTVAYNLPGIESGLKLDGSTLADIYLGKITKWNDPAIAKLNPDVKLPSTDITVVHRSDESGTTKLYTTYLADYSKAWENGPGVDKTVKWPTGTGAAKNAGVANAVKQTEGAIGYVELAYALQNDFTTADMQNAAGKFVAPSLESTQAAAAGVKAPSNLGIDAVNAPGTGSYPISSATHLLVFQDPCKAGQSSDTASNLLAWLDYALGDGQQAAEKLDYAPLPPALLAKAQAQVKTMTCNGSSITATS